MMISPMKDYEIAPCGRLVMSNWGPVAADRFSEQAYLGCRGGKYDPKFFVAHIEPFSEVGRRGIIGMCAYQRSMKMKDAFDLIWLAVHETYQGSGVGTLLTNFRLNEIRKQDGCAAFLVTQKPKYFEKFGFRIGTPLGNNWVEMCLNLRLADIG